jgi:hypothetical protein
LANRQNIRSLQLAALRNKALKLSRLPSHDARRIAQLLQETADMLEAIRANPHHAADMVH